VETEGTHAVGDIDSDFQKPIEAQTPLGRIGHIIQAFTDGMKHRLETTFGTVNADVLDRMDPTYRRVNFCSVILESDWHR
jgi:hypothetical protein